MDTVEIIDESTNEVIEITENTTIIVQGNVNFRKGIAIPITTAGLTIAWINPLGDSGNDYILEPFFYNETGYKGFIVTNRTNYGFTIIPDENGYFEYYAELRLSEIGKEENIIDITTEGYEVNFSSILGISGNSYLLRIFCYNNTGYKGFRIENRTETGFTIYPDENCILEYKATLL